MSYILFRKLIALTEEFEESHNESSSIKAFADWLSSKVANEETDLDWEGKKSGRSPESVINTSLVHLYRYAKVYSKIAISGSGFTTIDDVIFLINLTHSGSMSKKQLIDLNIHEKSTGTQIINRLIKQGYVDESGSTDDRRMKLVSITEKGKMALDANMANIRDASKKVVGNLTGIEKEQLIRLLIKLESHHQSVFKSGL